jgi:ATP adenylyltransferase
MAAIPKPCPFCKEIAALKTAQTDRTSAFCLPDANPVAAGHVLIVPMRHVERVTQLNDDEWNAVSTLLRKTLLELEERPDVDGVTIGINSGEAAGQTVSHAHVHLIPRRSGDCEDPRGGIRWVIGKGADYWNEGQAYS